MGRLYSWAKSELFRHRGKLLSLAVHAGLFLFLFGGLRVSSRMAPLRLPGTAQGVTLLTYYSPGSAQPVRSEMPEKKLLTAKAPPQKFPVPGLAKAEPAREAGAQAGVGSTVQSGLGEGDITIALETYFPYPKPDLSGLPRGGEPHSGGDVILDVVVDATGKISQLTLVRGLGAQVDDSVIATVKQWTYTPAMRQGVPVASERELHFHYEWS